MIRQYGNSPRITQLMSNMQQYLLPDANVDAFYNTVWNIDTAQGFGLDIWGRIVGVSRVIKVAGQVNNFGFNTTMNDTSPFGVSPFYTGPVSSNNYALSDSAFRLLIMCKALTNIIRTSLPAINQILQNLFPGRGNCYVNDLGGMQIRYLFQFQLQSWEVSILQTAGALPRPTGVRATIAQIPTTATFGFNEAGSNSQPFGQGTFLSSGAIANAA